MLCTTPQKFLKAKIRSSEFRDSTRNEWVKKEAPPVDTENLNNNPRYLGNGAK